MDREIETILCVSVHQAVEYAIADLSRRSEGTAVVVVGEEGTALELDYELKRRSASLAGAVGQAGLFITLAAQDIVRDRIRDEAWFEDFGVFDIEEAGRPERLFAVFHPDLPEPAKPHRRVAGNCPAPNKSFVRRHRERDELQDLFLHRQFVTVTGFPGVGKTMTAVNAARTLDEEAPDGLWWFAVEGRASLEELLQEIGTTKGLLALKGPVDVERIADALAGKDAILILDGCESMSSEIARFCNAIRGRSKKVSVILTSTGPLGFEDEHVYRLDPMTLVKPEDSGEDAVIVSEALALLYERATQAGASLGRDDRSFELAAQICQRVDGLPLAIELVAASLRNSSLQAVLTELEADRPDGFRSRLERLDRVLALSYQSLSAELRSLLHRLAMFRGEWKLEIALQVWGDQLTESELERLHRHLTDSSWLAYQPDRDTYRMLNTMRSYCESSALAAASSSDYGSAVVITEAGDNEVIPLSEADPALNHYCDQMAGLASKVCAGLQGADALEAETVLTRHYPDFLHALEVAIRSHGTSDCASLLMESMVHAWLARNLVDDAERVATSYLATNIGGTDAARAWVMLGVARFRRGRFVESSESLGRGLALCRDKNITRGEVAALTNLGLVMVGMGKPREAREYFNEVLPIARQFGSPMQLCQALCNASEAELLIAEINDSEKEECLRRAKSYAEEAGQIASSVGPVAEQAYWSILGWLARESGNLTEAETYLNRAVSVCQLHGLRHESGHATEELAGISLIRGLGPTAAKLLGLSRQIRRENARVRSDRELARYGSLLSELYGQVDKPRADRLMAYGEKLDLTDILSTSIYNA